MLEICCPKLVVLATCNSLFLAANLVSKMNVIAASGHVEMEKMVAWEDCFYNLLVQGYSISQAYEVTQAAIDIPMALLIKRDLILTL